MHCKLEAVLQDKIHFLYLSKNKQSSARQYEQGDLPVSRTVIGPGHWLDVWRRIKELSPEIIVMAGHYPRPIVLAIIWAALHRRHVAYWSDTNILDVQRTGWVRKGLEYTWKRFLFSGVTTFLYTGTRNRDFYESVIGRRKLEGRLFKVSFPALIDSSARCLTPGKEIRLLYLGRLEALKCIDTVIYAISLLPEQMQQMITFTIAGDGSERKRLELLSQNLAVHARVQFLGAIPSNETAKVYSEHDIFILPSRHEPWGLVVNEALAAGLPVIAPYWIGAVADLVLDGHTGFVMEDNRPETIARTLQTIIQMEQKKFVQIAENGQNIVKNGGFHLEGATASLMNFFKRASL